MLHTNKKILFFFFLGPHPWHMEVPRPRVESELQLPAYTTATATQNPSHNCGLHHSPRQHRILNPLSEARDRTFILMVPSRVRYHCATTGTPHTKNWNRKFRGIFSKCTCFLDSFILEMYLFFFKKFVLLKLTGVPLPLMASWCTFLFLSTPGHLHDSPPAHTCWPLPPELSAKPQSI